MATITQRAGRFFVRVRKKGFPTVTKTFTRRSDAAAWARRVEADMESGRWTSAATRPPTFREVVSEYRQVVAPTFKGADTYRYRFDEFEAASFANKPITEISPTDLAAWRDEQLLERLPGTVVRKLAMISGILTWAMKERGWITTNPAAFVSRPRSVDARDRTLSTKEVELLMQAARTSRARWLAPALIVLMNTAMRRGELCGLRRQDVDFDQAVARLDDTKNGSSRDVPLCPQSCAALRELDQLAKQRGDDLLLPVGPPGSLSTRFKGTVGRARAMYEVECMERGIKPVMGFLDDLRLHDLRHHAVTKWASTGALSLVELMAISGHKTPRMLMRYTHLQASGVALKLRSISAS